MSVLGLALTCLCSFNGSVCCWPTFQSKTNSLRHSTSICSTWTYTMWSLDNSPTITTCYSSGSICSPVLISYACTKSMSSGASRSNIAYCSSHLLRRIRLSCYFWLRLWLCKLLSEQPGLASENNWCWPASIEDSKGFYDRDKLKLMLLRRAIRRFSQVSILHSQTDNIYFNLAT